MNAKESVITVSEVKARNPFFRRTLSILAAVAMIVFNGYPGHAQVKAPETSVSFYSAYSTENYQPLWSAANRFGMVEEYTRASQIFRISGISFLDSTAAFDYAYGLDVVARGFGDASALYIHQAFASGKAGIFQLDVGRKERTRGHHAEGLSSGSLALSRNAAPIPLIDLSVPQFTPVPFTSGFIKFKGNLSHGWLEDTRFVKDAWLHQKSLYLQGGLDRWPVQGYAGMVHIVQWGGSAPDRGDLPSTFSDYITVFFGRGGGGAAPSGEQINALGNHLGIWDFGIKAESQKLNYHIYWQHFFEDGSGLAMRNIGDGLYGINVQMKQSSLLSGLLWEFIYTKGQSGPGLSDRPGDFDFCEEENCGYKYGGRDNYYNNGVYRSGWSYHGRIFGNPLMLTRRQVETHLQGTRTYQNMVEGNRVVGHHIGLQGNLAPNLDYRTLVTYVRHYGNYHGLNFGQRFGSKDPANDIEDYAFYPPLHQWHVMLETGYRFATLPGFDFTATLAFDTEDVANSTGLLFGVRWRSAGK